MQKKKPHGGKRKGSGRKKGEEKIRVYVPISKLAEVEKIIKPG